MGRIRLGWHMPAFPVDGSGAAAFVEQIDHFLRDIEPYIDSVWVDDHMVPWLPGSPNNTPYLECLTTIAYLAAAHPKMTFGTSVLCQSYRNPALLAKMAANLQLLTGGRFVFGIGAGWMEQEYRAYNFEFPKGSVRVDQLEETLQIVKRMWSAEPASFAGAHYRIEEAYCAPRPHPVPPIMIGGGGEQKTLRLVAQYADWWNLTGGSAATYAHKLDVLRRHCAAVGRDCDAIVKTWAIEGVAVAETEAAAGRIAAASAYKNDLLIGTPAQVAEQVQAFVDLGVEYLIVRTVDFPDTSGMQLFAHEVMPLLQAA